MIYIENTTVRTAKSADYLGNAGCYVLGSRIHAAERGNRTEWDGRVTIIPMTYDTFIRRAEKRMLGLQEKLKDAPFLKNLGLDTEAFVEPPEPKIDDLLGNLSPKSGEEVSV